MTWGGWFMLIFVWGFVLLIGGYCFKHILSGDDESDMLL